MCHTKRGHFCGFQLGRSSISSLFRPRDLIGRPQAPYLDHLYISGICCTTTLRLRDALGCADHSVPIQNGVTSAASSSVGLPSRLFSGSGTSSGDPRLHHGAPNGPKVHRVAIVSPHCAIGLANAIGCTPPRTIRNMKPKKQHANNNRGHGDNKQNETRTNGQDKEEQSLPPSDSPER